MQRLDKDASGTQHVKWARGIVATLRAHVRVSGMPAYASYLSDTQKAAIAREVAAVGALVQALSEAVTPYRALLETGFTDIRAAQRVADFLCDDGQREVEGLAPKKAEVEAYVAGGLKAIRQNQALSRVVRAGREATRDFARGAASLLRILPSEKFPTVEALAARLDERADLMQSFLDEERSIDGRRPALRAAVRKAINALRNGLEEMDARLRADFDATFIDSLYPVLDKSGRKVVEEPDEGDEDDDDVVVPGDAPTT